MPRNTYFDQRIQPVDFVIAPLESRDFDIDLEACVQPQVLVVAHWSTTAGTTGLSAVIHPGFAVNGTATYADNGNTITEFQSTVPDPNDTDQTIRVAFNLNPLAYPRRITITFTNNDTANSVTLNLYGDW